MVDIGVFDDLPDKRLRIVNMASLHRNLHPESTPVLQGSNMSYILTKSLYSGLNLLRRKPKAKIRALF